MSLQRLQHDQSAQWEIALVVGSQENEDFSNYFTILNKMKSLKVAKVEEMNDELDL